MMTSGKSVKITKKVKPIITWITFDFVNYFYNKCSNIYGHENIDRDIERDGMIMKRIIDYFSINNMSQRVVKRFIDWAIDKYTKDNKFTIPVTLGFISFWRGEYLNKSIEPSKKKKKREYNIEISDDTKNFLAKERDKYQKPKTRTRSGKIK